MTQTITKQEIQEWINFLYQDLLQDNILIGGYYFNLKQLHDFKNKKQQLDTQTKKLLSQIHYREEQLIEDTKKSSYKALQRAQNEDLNKLNQLSVLVQMKNKYNEKIEFPVMQEEFYYIYNCLEESKQDIEHFKQFLTEELQNENIKEEPGEFMYFINDYLQDLRQKFSGKSSV